MHRPQDIEKVLRKFPIEDVWGIGRRSAPKLKERGVNTAYDFTQMPENIVHSLLGITGVRTWKELQSVPCIEFEDGFEAKQSICVSRSFSSEIYDVTELQEQIANFASSMAEKLRKQRSVTAEMVGFAYTNRFKDTAPQTTQMAWCRFLHLRQTNERLLLMQYVLHKESSKTVTATRRQE